MRTSVSRRKEISMPSEQLSSFKIRLCNMGSDVIRYIMLIDRSFMPINTAEDSKSITSEIILLTFYTKLKYWISALNRLRSFHSNSS